MCPHFEWSLLHEVIRGIFHLCNVDAKKEKNSYFGAFQVSGLYSGMFNIINNQKMTEYLGGCAKIKCKYCYLCMSEFCQSMEGTKPNLRWVPRDD